MPYLHGTHECQCYLDFYIKNIYYTSRAHYLINISLALRFPAFISNFQIFFFYLQWKLLIGLANFTIWIKIWNPIISKFTTWELENTKWDLDKLVWWSTKIQHIDFYMYDKSIYWNKYILLIGYMYLTYHLWHNLHCRLRLRFKIFIKQVHFCPNLLFRMWFKTNFHPNSWYRIGIEIGQSQSRCLNRQT